MRTKPVAVVTGATSGIGKFTAYRLQARGYEVFAVGRNPAAIDALRSGGLQARSLDVTDEASVKRLVEEIDTEYGGVDLLVNNAGRGLSSPLEQVSLGALRSLFEINVVAMLHLSQAVLPGMRARTSGTIVNVGSTAGRFTGPGAGPYHISKYGVEALSLALRAEVRRFGVRVVLIEPTAVRHTNFIEARGGATELDAADDPYFEFKRRYDQITGSLADKPIVTVSADTVARAIVRAAETRDPKPRQIVGVSGWFTILLRALLSDRMWDRAMTRSLDG